MRADDARHHRPRVQAHPQLKIHAELPRELRRGLKQLERHSCRGRRSVVVGVGDAGHGQIFAYHVGAQRLELVYESSGPEAIDYPDNICLSPRGGMVICEDGGRDAQIIWGMAPDGGRFPLAQNSVVLNDGPQGFSGDFRRAEWAGCCFSPDGKWLFANVYKPGFTVAITGPWKTGLV